MKYLREFQTHSQYEAYTADTSNFIKPNVSTCINVPDEVHYNPLGSIVYTKYNVISTDNPIPIGYSSYTSGFSEIEIDGVIQPTVESAYTFTTTGEHTIKYTLTDKRKISDYAFYGCSGLTSIEIPSGVTSIGQRIFTNCSGLTSITVDASNSVYDSRNDCNAIIETNTNTLIVGCKRTVIPNDVVSIGDRAFEYCKSITSITIPDSVTSIGSYAFSNCSKLKNVEIPSGVTSIGSYGFYYCSGMTSINIPDGVTTIGDRTFDYCRSLSSLTIPDSVETIGINAFYQCGISSCVIGSGVTSIGSEAFGYCTNITSITSNAITAPTIQSNTFRNIKRSGTLYVPIGSSGYDVWMQDTASYLRYFGWTKVEQ